MRYTRSCVRSLTHHHDPPSRQSSRVAAAARTNPFRLQPKPGIGAKRDIHLDNRPIAPPGQKRPSRRVLNRFGGSCAGLPAGYAPKSERSSACSCFSPVTQTVEQPSRLPCPRSWGHVCSRVSQSIPPRRRRGKSSAFSASLRKPPRNSLILRRSIVGQPSGLSIRAQLGLLWWGGLQPANPSATRTLLPPRLRSRPARQVSQPIPPRRRRGMSSALNSISRIPATPSLRTRIANLPQLGIHSMDNQAFARRTSRQGQLLYWRPIRSLGPNSSVFWLAARLPPRAMPESSFPAPHRACNSPTPSLSPSMPRTKPSASVTSPSFPALFRNCPPRT